MTLTADATRINELFAEGHRLVFWFDPTADRAEEIDGIAINGKLLKLTGNNYLRTKVLLEHEDRESNYLIYAPLPDLKKDSLYQTPCAMRPPILATVSAR